ncbi:DUF6518 family protein [Streptomyces sp. NPDC089173]|uniref:DUF6518 family protein n=1 Tax=Streptomyces sp. NPDC089173 TaxID=3154965 RepID=UPI00344DE011
MAAVRVREGYAALSRILPRRRAGVAAVAAGSGLRLGVLTDLTRGWPPDTWQQLADSGAVRSAVAFVLGAVLYRHERLVQAALGGAVAEAGLVVGYYGYAEFGRDRAGSLFFPPALVAGPLSGAAGWWWRGVAGTCGAASRAWVRSPRLWGMEGLMYAVDLGYMPEAYACLAPFVLIPLLMARDHEERALTLGAAMVCALGAYGAVQVPLQMLSA